MIITYNGLEFFKITQGDMVLGLNPVSKNSKAYKNARFGADIAFRTVNHPDYNGLEQLSRGDRAPFQIYGPGDYEVKEIFIKGVPSETNLDSKKYVNTTYAFTLDGISVVFLGALSSGEFEKETRE